MTQNTSKQIRNLLESALEEMASSGSSYSLMNVNGAVESLRGSTEQKNEVKDIFAEAFETGIKLSNMSLPRKKLIINEGHLATTIRLSD